MKIAHIINSLPAGGAEKMLLESLHLIENKETEIDLILLNGEKTLFLDKIQKIFKGNIISLSKSTIYNPLHIFKLISLLKKYDIVHVHLFPALYFTAIAKLFSKSKTKLVFTEHSTNNRRFNNKYFLKLDSFIYSIYDKVVAITPQVKDVLIKKLKLSDDKVVVIQNGINIDEVLNALPYSKNDFFSQNDIILIMVGAFRIEKDQDTLIRSLIYLPQQYKMLLVGDGIRREQCEKLAIELSVIDRIKFLGNRSDVFSLMKTCDIVVLSSHWEGFGLVAVEGMASGKPVIVSDVDGLSQVVGDVGLKFSVGNEKELAQKIISLNDLDVLHSNYEKSISRSKLYDIKFYVKNIQTLYHDIMKRL